MTKDPLYEDCMQAMGWSLTDGSNGPFWWRGEADFDRVGWRPKECDYYDPSNLTIERLLAWLLERSNDVSTSHTRTGVGAMLWFDDPDEWVRPCFAEGTNLREALLRLAIAAAARITTP